MNFLPVKTLKGKELKSASFSSGADSYHRTEWLGVRKESVFRRPTCRRVDPLQTGRSSVEPAPSTCLAPRKGRRMAKDISPNVSFILSARLTVVEYRCRDRAVCTNAHRTQPPPPQPRFWCWQVVPRAQIAGSRRDAARARINTITEDLGTLLRRCKGR